MSQEANPFRNRAPRAAYLHIPFCLRKCGYCDFYSFCAAPEQIDAYVKALCTEITVTAAANAEFGARAPLATVYFGGGTPSLLTAAQLEALLKALDGAFGLNRNCEITLEANPSSADYERFLSYRAAGVNRLSLGIQSLQDTSLRRLERLHNSEQAQEALKAARKAGFLNLSADLMLGLPGQALRELLDDINLLLRLDLPHFSFYSLQIEEGTPFYSRYSEEAAVGEKRPRPDVLYAPLPTADEERAMYHFCREYMLAEGYHHYEISNMARPGYECRHNLTYWRAEPYWGFGTAAAAYVRGVRSSHPEDFEHYLHCFAEAQAVPDGAILPETADDRRTAAAESCTLVQEVVTRGAAMEEFFLLGLRLIDGVKAEDFKARFGAEVPDVLTQKLNRLVERGLLELSSGGWRLTLRGLDFGNKVFAEFV